jgi:malonyl-CoA/methylmalonyl-CoA synthetase
LVANGFHSGDRLCVYLANCVEMIDIYLACVKLGVIFVPINILYREREIAHIVSDAEPAAVLRTTETDRRSAVVPRHSARPPRSMATTPAGIIYTSGHYRHIQGRGPHAQ